MAKDYAGTFEANGSTDTYTASGSVRQYVIATGTFGGGTLSAQVSADGSTWVDIGDPGALTSEGTFWFEVESGMRYRLNLSGATSPSITWSIF